MTFFFRGIFACTVAPIGVAHRIIFDDRLQSCSEPVQIDFTGT